MHTVVAFAAVRVDDDARGFIGVAVLFAQESLDHRDEACDEFDGRAVNADPDKIWRQPQVAERSLQQLATPQPLLVLARERHIAREP